MNLLIVGGLFGVAILAIIGIVLLMVGERNAEVARTASAQPLAASAPEQRQPTSTLVTGKLVPREPDAPKKDKTSIEDMETNSLVPALNGQFHEFVAELRDLHRQAWEMEQRLSVLTKLVERAQTDARHHMNVEEDESVTAPDGQI